MQDNIKNYKELSLKIISILDKEDYHTELDKLLNKRQEIINKIEDSNNTDGFKMLYHKNNLNDIDENIKKLLQEKIDEVKKDIKEHKIKQQSSHAYANINKNNLNLFYEKV